VINHAELGSLLLQQGRVDLARMHLQEVYRLSGQYSFLDKSQPGFKDAEKNGKEAIEQMTKHITQVETQIREQMKQGAARAEMVGFALQMQCPLLGLKLLEEDKTVITKSPELQIAHAQLLLTCGRLEEALTAMGSLIQMMPERGYEASQPMGSELRNDYAMASLAIGDNIEAETRLRSEAELIQLRSVFELLDAPSTSARPALFKDLLPATQSLLGIQALVSVPDRWASTEFMMVQSELSTWRNGYAKDRLEKILKAEPNTSLRPMVEFYLTMLTGKPAGQPAKAAETSEVIPEKTEKTTEPAATTPSTAPASPGEPPQAP
jgi:hypothetical protein